jgi:hypothetical protein
MTAAPAQAGGLPSLTWSSSTASFDLGGVPAGQTASLTLQLTNSGGSATSALAILPLSPAPSRFSIVSDSCTGFSLGPRKSCSVGVQYTAVAGDFNSALLTATFKKPPQSASVTLTAYGALVNDQVDCQSMGGTFVGTPFATPWSCNGWTADTGADARGQLTALVTDCTIDGGALSGFPLPFTFNPPYDANCT